MKNLVSKEALQAAIDQKPAKFVKAIQDRLAEKVAIEIEYLYNKMGNRYFNEQVDTIEESIEDEMAAWAKKENFDFNKIAKMDTRERLNKAKSFVDGQGEIPDNDMKKVTKKFGINHLDKYLFKKG